MGSLFAIFCVTYVLYQNTFCNRIVSIFVQASNIGYTSNPFAGTNSIAVKGRVEIFELARKYYPTLTAATAV